MKNFIAYLVFALLFLVIENTLLHLFFPTLLLPDIVLIMVFYLGFSDRSFSGVLTAFSLGYLADVFSAGVLGASSFTLVVVFVVTSILAKLISLNSMLVKIGGAIFMSILKGILTYIVFRFLNQNIPFYIDRSYRYNSEGGDMLILNDKTIAIGISKRTDPRAIEHLARELFKANTSFETILAFNIPKTRAFMHLDTVFTQVDSTEIE